jgi:excinuclease ABC subunit A
MAKRKAPPAHDRITIQGARQHNLKNLDLSFPRNRLVVITGLSGSGKSSLAFDTLYFDLIVPPQTTVVRVKGGF